MWAEREDTNRNACRLETFYRLLIEILDSYFAGLNVLFNADLRFELNREYVLAYTKVEQILNKPNVTEFFNISQDLGFIPYDNVLFDDPFDYKSTSWYMDGGERWQAETFVFEIQKLIAESGGNNYPLGPEEEALVGRIREVARRYLEQSKHAQEERKRQRKLKREVEEANTSPSTSDFVSRTIGDFSFIRDADLRIRLSNYIEAANFNFERHDFLGVIYAVWSFLEEILYATLKLANNTPKRSKSEGANVTLLKTAATENLISPPSHSLAHAIRYYRNLTHPDNEHHEILKVHDYTAFMAIYALKTICSDLSRWYENFYSKSAG